MNWLLDSSPFFTRNHCGVGWTPELISLSRLANFLVFFSYFSIPISLLLLWLNLKKLRLDRGIVGRMERITGRDKWVLLMFAAFIFSCGMTHLNDVIVFDYAPYRYFTAVDVVTATLSVPTAILLPVVAKRVLRGLSEECNE